MNFKTLLRTILATAVFCGLAAQALSQIPVPPPFPGLEVRITTGGPPAVRHEHQGPRPGRDYVWVAGFWHSDGGRWEWVPGRWERPVARDAHWIAPRYIRAERGYIYEPGHWSNQRVIVSDDIRERSEWRHHERDHEREIDREHNHDYHHDNDRDRDNH